MPPPPHTQILSSNMLMIDLVGLIWEMRTLYLNLEVSDQPLVLWEMSEFLVLLRLPPECWFTGVYSHAWLVRSWGFSTGLLACQASTPPTKADPQPPRVMRKDTEGRSMTSGPDFKQPDPTGLSKMQMHIALFYIDVHTHLSILIDSSEWQSLKQCSRFIYSDWHALSYT